MINEPSSKKLSYDMHGMLTLIIGGVRYMPDLRNDASGSKWERFVTEFHAQRYVRRPYKRPAPRPGR